SSRRRHTRLVSDWSSDVCSSDLGAAQGTVSYGAGGGNYHPEGGGPHWRGSYVQHPDWQGAGGSWLTSRDRRHGRVRLLGRYAAEIGRASCRERGEVWGGGGACKT